MFPRVPTRYSITIEPFLDELRKQANAPEFLIHLEEVARQVPNAESRLQQARERHQAAAAASKDAT